MKLALIKGFNIRGRFPTSTSVVKMSSGSTHQHQTNIKCLVAVLHAQLTYLYFTTGDIIINKEFCVGGSKAKMVLYFSYSTARCELCYIIRL